ncbi:MAG TPA: bifunctional alpha/beta hydrolase/OsmC family protein [Thermoanaerobaculia bacterium]|nr:bifunctional alpha/beta hydrolase/OsmC family protein [Thermoanaerobaculia bacterium]
MAPEAREVSERVEFPGSQGARLAGRIEVPEGEPAAYALFAHCFTCSKDLKSAGGISRELLARGIAVLRFDFTGLGESGGDFADTNFSSNVEDLVAAADFLRRERQAPALLVGHSLGGTAMLAAAPRIPEALAVATIGAPSDTGHLRAKLAARVANLGGPAAPAAGPAEEEAYELDLGGLRPVHIRRQLLEDLAGDHLHGVLPALGRPLLLFHSPVDRVVGIDHAERLFLAARHPKSFVSLGDADHLLSDPRDAAQAGAVLAAWAGRYLPAGGGGGVAATAPTAPTATVAAAGAAAEPRALTAGEVEVTGTAHSLRQEVRLGAHHLVADEPAADGGTDAGPTPYALLLAALGTCSSMTMRLYADRKGWPLAGTRVRLRHSRDHEADCENCVAGDARIERIDRELELLGPLTEAQRVRLAEIADHCPVHRTLRSRIEIVTKLL